MKDKALLITGGSGFIGQFLCEYLEEKNIKYYAPDRNKLNLECHDSTLNYFLDKKKANIEIVCVIHLASIYRSRKWSEKNNYSCYKRNSLIHINLFSTIDQTFPYCKIISTLSYTMYNKQSLNLSEIDINENSNQKGVLQGYTLSKKLNLNLSDLRNQDQQSINSICLILPTVYSDPIRMNRNTFVGEVYHKLMNAKIKNCQIELFGSGEEVREFLYIQDLCESIFFFINNETQYDVYNLGSGLKITISEFVQYLSKHYGFTNGIIFKNKSQSQDKLGLDSTRLRNEFNYNFNKNLVNEYY